MLKYYTEIIELRSEGICESCDYGVDRCLQDGKAFCKYGSIEKEEVKNNEEESV